MIVGVLLHTVRMIYYYFFLLLLIAIIFYINFSSKIYRQKHRPISKVGVVVLGDIERSPRMLYHIDSLLQNCKHLNIKVFCFTKEIPGALKLIIKTIMQTILLLWHFLISSRMDVLLLQNPPSIPTIPVALMCCYLKSSKLIIDWHNYGHTILKMKMKNRDSLLVSFYRYVEMRLGRYAWMNITVTQAMRIDLIKNHRFLGDRIIVFPDYPAPVFKRCDLTDVQKYTEMSKILCNYNIKIASNLDHKKIKTDSAMLVSSTSWTEDENFDILLDVYDKLSSANDDFPFIYCIVTGKGPLKDHYIEKIAQFHFKNVHIDTVWLSYEDYGKILSYCTIGVSLHVSSSGLDFPMKVIDMFGCGLPVCAMEFSCIQERITPNENGLIFRDAKGLNDCLKFKKGSSSYLDEMRGKIKQEDDSEQKWDPQWNLKIKPILLCS